MAKVCIAPNLYLLTKPNGTRYYIARFKRDGKQIERSLGNADTISLREAKLNLARVMVGFEETEKRPETKSLCFADALPMALNDIAVIKQWRNEKSRHQWEQTLRDYALPLLGPLALSDITRADILAVIKPIWFTKNETASRLRMRLEAILSWAIHHGYRTDANPAVWKANLEFDLPSKGKVQTVEHHEALTIDEARKVVSYCLSHPSPVSAAILFGIATASRVNEFRMATREEIDGDVWLVPPDRRKDGRPYPHRVPLSSLAKKALEMAAAEGPLFVANRRVIAADSPRLKLIAILGRKVTMHGCRSTFRDWCAINGVDHALAEKALSHKWGSNVTQAYLREDMLEQRRGLMQMWAETIMSGVLVLSSDIRIDPQNDIKIDPPPEGINVNFHRNGTLFLTSPPLIREFP